MTNDFQNAKTRLAKTRRKSNRKFFLYFKIGKFQLFNVGVR